VTFTPATWPVGIQIDGNYGRFPTLPADRNLQMIYGTGNIVYRFQTSSGIDLPPLPDRRRRRVQPQGDG
jgi:hypothetical protein